MKINLDISFNYIFSTTEGDRLVSSQLAPGKKDHTYKGRAQGRSLFEQKRYLLWPLKDLHESLNVRYEPDDENSYLAKFGKELPFGLFYQFIRENKEYVYNEEKPHFSCLCEVCEN